MDSLGEEAKWAKRVYEGTSASACLATVVTPLVVDTLVTPLNTNKRYLVLTT